MNKHIYNNKFLFNSTTNSSKSCFVCLFVSKSEETGKLKETQTVPRIRSSKLTICWPSHFVTLLCDSNRSTIRRFSVRLSKSENSFELQIIFKMLIFISVISLTRGKSEGSSRNFRVSCCSSGGHKTHHFHLITLDILRLSSPARVSSKLLSKVAQIWRQGLMNVILSQVFWR